MNSRVHFAVLSLIWLVILCDKTHAFCDAPSEDLSADLTQAVVRSSDWLRKTYRENTTVLRPYRAGSLFATLRIAGHYPDTLLSEFKDGQGFSIDETLKNYLYSVQQSHGNLSSIAPPHLGLIIQGVVSICQDPENFHGYDLIQPLHDGFSKFKKQADFNNYFGYSLAVIALCNADHIVPDSIIQELIEGAKRVVSYHSVDTDALILTALSCVRTSNSSLQHEVDRSSHELVESLISMQNNSTGAFGNQYSTALAVEALQAARVHTDTYECEKALRNILSYQGQDEEGSFGSILANIQVTPALLGESLISLKEYHCPAAPTPSPTPQVITVSVELVFKVAPERTEPEVSVNITEGQTAYNALELAKLQNPCYNATYKQYSFGRSITSICDVSSDGSKSQYWLIDVNGKSAKFGVDGLKPKDGDLITFKYVKLN
ncbi:transcobalamin-2-like [Dendronephthya gigantea]|uniref:transcobalamin-2-like n=1 Tax=Dendronephthya gigantea TaxID=151771 RepID=UPI00106D0CE0|nr:transcobalamin-2-like [Dendronephthya gigantea]